MAPKRHGPRRPSDKKQTIGFEEFLHLFEGPWLVRKVFDHILEDNQIEAPRELGFDGGVVDVLAPKVHSA